MLQNHRNNTTQLEGLGELLGLFIFVPASHLSPAASRLPGTKSRKATRQYGGMDELEARESEEGELIFGGKLLSDVLIPCYTFSHTN